MLKPAILTACAAALCLPLTASLAAPLAAMAAPPPANVAPEKVVSAVTGDFNDDGSVDRAVLVNGDDDSRVNLIVYFNTDKGFSVGGFARDIAYSGGMAGNMPELRIGKTGGLQVYSENMAVGRDHWEQTMSLAWRNSKLVVSGLTFMHYDTLDPDGGGTCDVNFLTGKGTATAAVKGVNKTRPVVVAPGGVPVEQWTDDKTPKACQ